MDSRHEQVGQPRSYTEQGQSAKTIYSSNRRQRVWCCSAESPLLPVLYDYFRRKAPVSLQDLHVYTFDVVKKQRIYKKKKK